MTRNNISCITLLCCLFLWAQSVFASPPIGISKERILTRADFQDFFQKPSTN